MVHVWKGVLYSVVRLQKCSGATLHFTVLNPELYQKLDFMVFQLITANLSTTSMKNRAVNKHQVSQTAEYDRPTPTTFQLRLSSLNVVISHQ